MCRDRRHQLRVHERELCVHRPFVVALKERPRVDQLVAREHEHVLAVEGEDGGVRPDQRANPVDNGIAMVGEALDPVVGPLLVQVIRPALVWDRRREERARRVLDDVANELIRTVLG